VRESVEETDRCQDRSLSRHRIRVKRVKKTFKRTIAARANLLAVRVTTTD
jgi:hypothetical protein